MSQRRTRSRREAPLLYMSDPSRTCCGGRFVAVSAVAFLLPHAPQQLSWSRSKPQDSPSSPQHPSSRQLCFSTPILGGGIQIAPPLRSSATAAAGARGTRCYGGSNNNALFAAAVASSEGGGGDDADESPYPEEREKQEIATVVLGRRHEKPAAVASGGSHVGDPESRPRRRQRSRLVVALGRGTIGLLRRGHRAGLSTSEDLDDHHTKLNSVVAERADQVRSVKDGTHKISIAVDCRCLSPRPYE